MVSVTTDTYLSRLEETLPRVLDRMGTALSAAGRAPDSVKLVAVTKGHPLEAVEAALSMGLTDLGENRVEELERKVGDLGDASATWHLIGHVQGRKARLAIDLADLIHSVDSVRLGERISRMAVEDGGAVSVLAQVNTSGEMSKSGLPVAEAVEGVQALAELPGLRVEGLMTMAPFVDDESVLSKAFASLRKVSEEVRSLTDQVGPELSMGMTNDMEIAIREGSTMVRIGTALFGER